MSIFNIIKRDLQTFQAYPDINLINERVSLRFFLKALLDIDYRAIFMYRLSCFLINSGVKKIGLLIYYRLKSAHAIDISPFAKIGPGLKIVHAFNIVIGPDVIIGKDCVLFNSVTLGNSHPSWKLDKNMEKFMPVIEDRVTLCPGSRIIGKVKVGHDAFIAANAVVIKNVPAFETWGGVPAKRILKN